MFKILVADDERFIRKGIISMLSRNLKVEVSCVEASNGIEALEQSKLETPSLIITDISMPGLNGLDFIAALKEQNVNTPVIILSGYENFDYAKSAIKLGVKEYMMKPIKKQEFVELIQGYIDDIQESQRKNEKEIISRIETEKAMKRLKHDFLVGLLNCTTSEESKRYLKQLQDIGMTFESKLYTCAAVQYQITSQSQDYMDFAVKNILDEFMNMEGEGEFLENVEYGPGVVVVIFESSSRELLREPKKKLMRRAVQLIKEYCKTEAFAGLGDVAFDAVHLHAALEHAMTAAEYKILGDGDSVCVYEASRTKKCAKVRNIKEMLRPLDQANVFEVLDAFQGLYIEERKLKEVSVLKEEYTQVQEYVSRQLAKRHLDAKIWDERYRHFFECWTIQELKQEIKERMEMAADTKKDSGSGNVQLLEQIRAYVDEHITEELDLNNVADKFNRTPGYVSTLFKKYVEGGFNSYLTKERIEIAKKLLADSSVSIQEVSEMSGYNNSKYFSVVFKKMTGETPRGYREKFMK